MSQAAFDPTAAAGLLVDTRLKLLVSDVLGAPATEQWFAIADQLFEQMPSPPRQMHQRVRRFLLEYTYVVDRDKDFPDVMRVFEDMNRAKLDEALLIRSRLVRNGGRVSSALARHPRRPVGVLIEFEAGLLGPILKPLRALADTLGALHL